jgi:hypothetical protein
MIGSSDIAVAQLPNSMKLNMEKQYWSPLCFHRMARELLDPFLLASPVFRSLCMHANRNVLIGVDRVCIVRPGF